MVERQAMTVTGLNEYIKNKLETDPLLSRVLVKGEISNFVNHYKTGHFYLSLKDEGGVIRAVMFRMNASKLNFVPENGMKVICSGRVSSYVKDGQYQLYISDMQPDGIGALYVAFGAHFSADRFYFAPPAYCADNAIGIAGLCGKGVING